MGQEWIDRQSEGLGLLFASARSHEESMKAIEAFLEVLRLQMARS